jgi:hypothetical protein
MGTDPFGLARRVIEPTSEQGRRIMERYVEAYEATKTTPTGHARLEELETDPDFLLEVVFDPSREGLIVEPQEYDNQGLTLRAVLRVGKAFPAAPGRSDHYPQGSKLTRKNELGVYTVGHEEIGHFLTGATDPAYNARKRAGEAALEEARQRRAEIRERVRGEILNSGLSERRKRRKLKRLEQLTTEVAIQDPELIRLREISEGAKSYVEHVADEVGFTIVEEYRDLKRE